MIWPRHATRMIDSFISRRFQAFQLLPMISAQHFLAMVCKLQASELLATISVVCPEVLQTSSCPAVCNHQI